MLPFLVIWLRLLVFSLLVFLVLGVFGGGVSFPQGLLDILNALVLFSPSVKLLMGPTVPLLQVIPKLDLRANSTYLANNTLPLGAL